MANSSNSPGPASNGGDTVPGIESDADLGTPAGGAPAEKPVPKPRSRAKAVKEDTSRTQPAAASPRAGKSPSKAQKAGTAARQEPVADAVEAGAAQSRPATAEPEQAGRPPGRSDAGSEATISPGAADARRVSDEERQRRIAEAAYRKAEQRGFSGARQLEDWLEAEREHDGNEGGGR